MRTVKAESWKYLSLKDEIHALSNEFIRSIAIMNNAIPLRLVYYKSLKKDRKEKLLQCCLETLPYVTPFYYLRQLLF